ncbi:MAG: hypothetical protein IJ490_01545 [Chlamydia sp.]|nr:hypothetical protein [Chlamydia sp.]
MRIQNSSPSIPPVTSPSSPFSQSGLLGKITRIVVALLLVLISLGMILLAYSFSDLLNYRFCISVPTKQSKALPIPKPVPKSGSVIEQLSKEVVDTYLQSHQLPELNILDNSQIFQFMCALHDQYPQLLPCDCLVPLTIFNYQEEVCSVLKSKQKADTSLMDPLKDYHPITCPPANYFQLLKQARVLPFVLWYDPECRNYQQTLNKMQQLSSLGISENSHWTLIIVDLSAQCITYFDSQKNYIAPVEDMKQQMEELADRINELGFHKDNKTSFDVHIAVSEELLQSEMGLCCGLWCCQYMKWYMENISREILTRIPNSPEYKTLLLHSLYTSFKESTKPYANLSWPKT